MFVVDDLTISLMVLIGVRLLASLVFVELLLRRRESKYAVLALAWLAYAAGPVWGLVGYLAAGDADHPLFGYFAAVGTLLLMGGVFTYYRAVPRTRLLVVISLVVAALGIGVWLYPAASGVFAVLAQLIFIGITFTVLVFKRRWFLTFGGDSYYWLFPITLLSLFHAFGFRFVYPGAPFSVRLLLTFLVNVSLIIFFLHFEYNRSLMRLSKSEERYRFLFNASPVALWEEDATEIIAELAGLRLQGISDIRQEFDTHPKFLAETLGKRRMLNVNQEAVLLFQASSKQELTSKLGRTFRPESARAFAEAVACLFEGIGHTTIETVVQTLEGETRDVIVDISFPNPDDSLNSAIVSMVDISGRKRVEERARHLLDQQIAVNQLALALGETSDLDTIYRTIYHHVRVLVDAEAFIVAFYDGKTRLIRAAYVVSSGEVRDATGFPPIPLEKMGKGTQSQVIHTGKPLYIPDYRKAMEETDTEYVIREHDAVEEGPPPPEEQEVSTNSALYVPMKIEGETIGVLQVQSHRLNAYTQEDIHLLTAMANVATVAVMNARLYEAVQKELAERARAEEEVRRLNAGLEQRVSARTGELQGFVDAMAGREVRMAELKGVIRRLRAQLEDAGLTPMADDPLLGDA